MASGRFKRFSKWTGIAGLVIGFLTVAAAGLAAEGSTLTIAPMPMGDELVAETATVVVDGEITITANPATGYPPYSYTWQKEPYEDAGLSGVAALTISAASERDAGIYRVVVTDAYGDEQIGYVNLRVSNSSNLLTVPDCTIISCVAAICEGMTTPLCGVETPGYSYLWDGPEQSGATSRCITVGTGGTYYLTVTDSAGNQATCSRYLRVWPAPPCAITGDEPRYPDCQVTWCGPEGQFYSYLWSGPEQDGATTRCITISTSGIYTLTVTESHGCQSACARMFQCFGGPTCEITGPETTCEGTPVEWCANDGTDYTYLWSGPEQDGATTRCITIGTAGEYCVTVTDASGVATTCCKTLTVFGLPACDISGPEGVCEGRTVEWCATDGTDYTYLWSGPEQDGATSRCVTIGTAGEYCVTITSPDGCQTTCCRTLTIYGGPTCEITGPNEVCGGKTVEWCANEGLDYTYLWHGPEQDGATARCITIGTAGEYCVIVADGSGCRSRCCKTLSVYDGPPCEITGPGVICGCYSVEWCGPVGDYTYLWNGPQRNGATSRCISICTPGCYTLTVTDRGGCKSTCSKCLVKNPKPTCCLRTPDPLPQCESTGNVLTANVTGDVVEFVWSVSGTGWEITDGQGTRSITYAAGAPGSTGRFTLDITDANGCTSKCDIAFTCRSTHRWCTFTQGGWGSKCPCNDSHDMMSTQPGCVRDHYFCQVFPHGVKIGGSPHWAKWTTASAVKAFLPAGGTSGALTHDYTNPTRTSAGVLAGQLLALRLNREFSCSGVLAMLGLGTPGFCLGDFVIPASCGKFAGLTVDQFLALADQAVAGNSSVLNPYGARYSDLTDVADCLNQMFDDCRPCGMDPLEPELSEGESGEDSADGNLLAAPTPDLGTECASACLEFGITQISPNPMATGTVIQYALPAEGRVTIEVYDVAGKKVVTLIDDTMPAGIHNVMWDGTDSQGANLTSGLYFCRATFGDLPGVNRKMIKLQ